MKNGVQSLLQTPILSVHCHLGSHMVIVIIGRRWEHTKMATEALPIVVAHPTPDYLCAKLVISPGFR